LIFLTHAYLIGVGKAVAKQAAGKAIQAAARKIFARFDTDGNGEIDESELGGVLISLLSEMGKAIPPTQELERQVKRAMSEFDTDGNGHIDFHEFVVMITKRPWKNLLPKECQELIVDWPPGSNSIAISNPKANTESNTKPAHDPLGSPPRAARARPLIPGGVNPSDAIQGATRSSAASSLGNEELHSEHQSFVTAQAFNVSSNAASAAAAAFQMRARKLFAMADADGNGMVDEEELVACLTQLHSDHSQAWSNLTVKEEAKRHMKEFAVQGNITYEAFLRLIASPSFTSILPRELRGLVPKAVHVDARHEMGKNTAKAAAGVAVMREARKIFNEADGDNNGAIDRAELEWVVEQLWVKMGVVVKNMSREKLLFEVEEVFEHFDTDRDGVISFQEFLKMITTDPWRKLLPIHVQAQIVPFVGDGRTAPQVSMPMNLAAKTPSAISTGRLGGGPPRATERARVPDRSNGYDLVGPPQAVRVKTFARHHTRDLQYALAETQAINSKLAVTQSQPPRSHKVRHTAMSSW